ncbi:MAG: hypothetical protein HOQ12_03645 [Gemmatimonadaceae bacterium]|nr:hypothetical protein [Gemmatimonadaceae bacterium]NUQ92583.1 hypothetical protein [Gemmatimonadaceae bacterium]NUR18607.1 hypothetical protein [Gemmatimonadaceae bacterium]
MPVERRAPRAPSHPARAGWLTVAAFLTAALAVAELRQPAGDILKKPFQNLAIADLVSPSADAFGKSGEVKLRVALPGEDVEYPLEVEGDPTKIRYSWVRTGSDSLVDAARPLGGAKLVAPSAPGMYHLALLSEGQRTVVSEMTVAVLVPFAEKVGSSINGYRIGTYLAEKLGGRHDAPEGFIEVGPQDVDLAVTKHFRVGDFLTHDGQSTWPRYVALDPKLLDKLELVIEQVVRMRGDSVAPDRSVALDVHSGFRTPIHNVAVKRSARDSRHQYGDAADVTIDANFDGRFTAADSRLVALAVEAVEQDHPELRGGMGLYTSRRYSTPYVHIDARGKRARWRG